MNRQLNYILPLISGLAMAAAFQYTALFWLAWVALVPLFFCLCGKKTRRGMVMALVLYAAAFYLPVLSFVLALHPLDYLGFSNSASLALLVLGWLLLAAWETGGFVLLGLALKRLRPQPGLLLPLVCALWLLLEWLQALSSLGFTWGRLAVAQAACPAMIQSAALGGSLLVSALVLAVNALLAWALFSHKRRFLLLALALFALNAGGGALRLALPAAESTSRLNIAVVQGTLPSQQKWQSDTDELNHAQYRQQSLAAAQAGAQLILWPETCLAEVVNQQRIPADDLYRQVARESKAALLAGALWREESGQTYNALLYTEGPELQALYGKRHLVPFGEYLPLRGILEPLIPGLTAHLSAGIIPYVGDGLVRAVGSDLGALICYESIFAPLARSSVDAGAQALLVVTNDSWFWGTPAMRHHYLQAQLRAVEQNRWLLRAANAGFSGIIDNYGRSLQEIAPEDSGYLLADTPLIGQHTAYFYLREWVSIAALVLIMLSIWRQKMRP